MFKLLLAKEFLLKDLLQYFSSCSIHSIWQGIFTKSLKKSVTNEILMPKISHEICYLELQNIGMSTYVAFECLFRVQCFVYLNTYDSRICIFNGNDHKLIETFSIPVHFWLLKCRKKQTYIMYFSKKKWKKINAVKSFFIIWNYYIHPFIKHTMKKTRTKKIRIHSKENLRE